MSEDLENFEDFEDWEECKVPVLDLCALDKASSQPLNTERPQWEQISRAIDRAYTYGGSVSAWVLKPENSYIKYLDMSFLPKQFRIVVLTRDENPKNELLEWWEPGDAAFRGTIRFGDDEWDARTVSSDVSIAHKIFRELYDCGKLSSENLSNLRPQWNPKP